MRSFFNRYFNTRNVRVAFRDCLTGRYSAIERQAIAHIQSNIKDFLSQYGEETLLMDVYNNLGRFNPLIVGEKPIFEESWKVGELLPLTSINKELGGFLFLLAYRLRPAIILELGTHLGISGMYLAGGISLNPYGVLYTIDRSKNSLKYAKMALKPWQDRIKIINGEFSDVFQGIISECGRIELAFIDGDHQKGAMLKQFEIVSSGMKNGGVVVFDDIDWSSYTVEEWKKISVDKHIFFSKDCGRFGFIVVK